MMRISLNLSDGFIFPHLINQSSHDDFSGTAPRISGALFLLTAEIPEHDVRIRHIERNAQTFQPADDFRRVTGQIIDSIRVSQIYTPFEGIRIMIFDIIIFSHGIECRIDTALC